MAATGHKKVGRGARCTRGVGDQRVSSNLITAKATHGQKTYSGVFTCNALRSKHRVVASFISRLLKSVEVNIISIMGTYILK